MPISGNFPGPYELRITYSVSTITPVLEHSSRLNVALNGTPDAGLGFDEYFFVDKNGVNTIDLATLVEDWLTVFNANLNTNTAITAVELWKYPTAQSFDSVFWAAYEPTAAAGTNVTGAQASAQQILTFRTLEGGTLKVSIMEGVVSAGSPQAYAAMSTPLKNLADFITDGDGSTYSAPFLGRDTSYPLAFHRHFPGQNEALFKKRNRP